MIFSITIDTFKKCKPWTFSILTILIKICVSSILSSLLSSYDRLMFNLLFPAILSILIFLIAAGAVKKELCFYYNDKNIRVTSDECARKQVTGWSCKPRYVGRSSTRQTFAHILFKRGMWHILYIVIATLSFLKQHPYRSAVTRFWPNLSQLVSLSVDFKQTLFMIVENCKQNYHSRFESLCYVYFFYNVR